MSEGSEYADAKAKELAFPREEYAQRLAAVQDGMAEARLDALLIFDPENLFYLTGFETIGYASFHLALVPASGEPLLLVREMEQQGAWRSSWMTSEPVIYRDDDEPAEAAVSLLQDKDLGRARIGINPRSRFLPVDAYRRLHTGLPYATLLDEPGLVERARMVKSAAEVECIRRAARYTEAGMAAAIAAIRPGALDNEVGAAAAAALFAAGSEYLSADPIVTVGPRSGVAHTTFARHRINPGDAVLLEIGAVHRRYAGPLMRSAVVGPPSDLIRRLYDACDRALVAAISAMHPGATGAEVHAACQRVIDDAGFEANFRKRTGYSVGVGFAPDWGEGHIVHLSRKSQTPLQPGMVFHLPPALREQGVAGVGCSETVLVTEDGAEVLTSFPRDLRVC
jgi:Xaa-Pro dipeptidase